MGRGPVTTLILALVLWGGSVQADADPARDTPAVRPPEEATEKKVGPVSQPEAAPTGRRAGHRQELARRRARAATLAADVTGDVPLPMEPAGASSSVPNLGLLSVVVSDPLPDGNADGWIQPGEIVTLQISLSNFGNSTATAVFGTLNPGETNPYVTILDKTADWTNVPAHGTATSNAPHFLVQVSNTLPCGYTIELTLDVHATGYSALIPIRLDLARPYTFDLVADATRRYNESDGVIYGADANDVFGYSVASGDVNGDGFDDLILGALFGDAAGNAKSSAGDVWVIYGSSEGIPPVVDTAVPPAGTTVIYGADASDQLGYSVSAGDLNGDGFDDLILGAAFGDGAGNARVNGGDVWVIYGQAAALPATIDLAAPPSNAKLIYAETGDKLGNSLSAGDINGDGFDDLILGAILGDGAGNAKNAAGDVWVIYGQAAQLPSATDLLSPPSNAKVIYGPDANDNLGWSVSAGDLNGDGFDDLILGAVLGNAAGNAKGTAGDVWVIYGQTAQLPSSTDLFSPPLNAKVIYGADAGDNLGNSVSAGDINGDGFDDLILGAIFGDAAGNAKSAAGDVWVIYGQAAQLPSSTDLFSPPSNAKVLYGADAGDNLGYSVSSGDVNGDGFDDLILGAVLGSAAGNAKGTAGDVWAIYGQTAQLPSSTDLFSPPLNAKVIYGADAGDNVGYSVPAGDVNGDGFDDLILGAAFGDAAANAKSAAGEVHVINGSATTTYWHKAETFAFVDATSGTKLNLACDDCSTPVSVGFTFPYYGEKFTTVYVSSNGFVSFAPIDDLISPSPRCISSKSPSSLSSQALLVAPLWDDLDLRTSGSVYTLLSGTAPDRRLTIAWVSAPHYPNTGAATFEVSLYESTGRMLFQYQDVDFGNSLYNFGASASVGVQNETAAEGTPYLCTTAGLANSQAVSFNLNTPLFIDNMESMDTSLGKPGKWTIAGGSASQWHSESGASCGPNFHGRIKSLYEGLDATCTYVNSVAGDTLNLPQVSSFPADGRLAYWERFQSQATVDLGRVEIQGNGGGYTSLVSQSGGTGTWQSPIPLFLNANAGQNVDLRHRFASDASTIALGWMLDDVRLVGCNAKGITGLASAAAFAQPPVYCGDGSHTGLLDAVGSFCGDGAQPTGFQWIEGSVPIGGSTGITYSIPAGHSAGTFDFSVAVTCAGGSATSAPQEVQIVAPPSVVGSTLGVGLQNNKTELKLTWGDVAGSSSYVVFEDTVASGAFTTVTGTATSGVTGLTIPTPSAPLVFYLIAGSNETCGAGPKR